MMDDSNIEVLDLTHVDDSILTQTHTHDSPLVSRHDDATHPHGHQQPPPKLEHPARANLKKRTRTDSVLDEAPRSLKKRKPITGFTSTNPLLNYPISSQPTQRPSTPPPTRKSRSQRRKRLASVTKAPRQPSRFVLAARAAALSSSPESQKSILISDNDTPSRAASQSLQRAVKVESSPAALSIHNFWDEQLPATGLQTFATSLHATTEAVLPSTEISPSQSSGEGYFLAPSPALLQPSAPLDTDVSKFRGVPVLGASAFHTLQSTSAKLSHDGLPQLPHALTHPATSASMAEIMHGLPEILQNFEERLEEKFRDVREEIYELAGCIDEIRGGGVRVE